MKINPLAGLSNAKPCFACRVHPSYLLQEITLLSMFIPAGKMSTLSEFHVATAAKMMTMKPVSGRKPLQQS